MQLIDIPVKRLPSGLTSEKIVYLRANVGVDPHILADALGVTPRWVIMCQRKLGIRKMTSPSAYRKNRCQG